MNSLLKIATTVACGFAAIIGALLIYGYKTSCSGVAVYVKCHDFWDMPTFLLTAIILGIVGVAWSAHNSKKIKDVESVAHHPV